MRYFLVVVLMLAIAGCSCSDESVTKRVTKKVVSTAVSTSKDAISGVKDGVEEGRKEGESLDSALVLYSPEDISEQLEVYAESITKTEQTYSVVLVLKNSNERSVRVTKIDDLGNSVLLDSSGFATPLSVRRADITVLPKSASRLELKFNNVSGKPAVIRFFKTDYPLPEVTDGAAL